MSFVLKALKSGLVVLTLALTLAACGVQPFSSRNNQSLGSGSTTMTDSDGQPVSKGVVVDPLPSQTPMDYSGGGTEEQVF